MANTITSAAMGLPVPIVGVEAGPQYSIDINACLALIDAHDHSPGKGVQVTPAGINITTDISFNSNNLTSAKSLQFIGQPSPLLTTATIYAAANGGTGVYDLWFNDGAGNQIPLTLSGAVNATIANIPGESYSGGTFTWKQGTGSTTPANFDIGSIIIRPNTAGTSNGVQLVPPGGIASQYSIGLPLVPGSKSIVTLDTSGNLVADTGVDNVTLQNVSNVISIKSQGVTASQIANNTITAAQIANNTITRAQEAAVGQQLSSSCGQVNLANTFTAVANLSVTITVTGRPVFIGMVPDGTTGSAGGGSNFQTSGAGQTIAVKILRGATLVAQSVFGSTGANVVAPVAFSTWDIPTAGTYTYTVQAFGTNAGNDQINFWKLLAFEL